VSLLELTEVTKNFQGLVAVDDVTFNVEKNTVHALIGPNGAGKTTVFNLITGVYILSNGTIYFDGSQISGKKSYQIVQSGIARTFQNIRLFQKMSALENVLVGCHCRTKADMLNILYRFSMCHNEKAESYKRCNELMDYFKLSKRRHELSGNLPYGHQRLLEIARALATQPKLLLLDEPAAGMNSEEKGILLTTIKNIVRDFDMTVLMVEHDMELVMNIADDMTVLNFGHKIAGGPPREIQANQDVIEAYLGVESDDDVED
jgi:branched-chain amino acid transport system ATP-binding protein